MKTSTGTDGGRYGWARARDIEAGIEIWRQRMVLLRAHLESIQNAEGVAIVDRALGGDEEARLAARQLLLKEMPPPKPKRRRRRYYR